MATVQFILSGKLIVFYKVFFAFSTAIKYYNILVKKFLFSLPKTSNFYYNSLFFEPQSFWKLAKYFHAKKLKNAMRIEFTTLKNKNTWIKVFKNKTK